MIVYTGAAGYMSGCQTNDLLVAMTAARNAAQLVTLIPDEGNTLVTSFGILSNTTSKNEFLVSVGPWSRQKINGDRFRPSMHLLSTLDPAKIYASHNTIEISPLVDTAKAVLCYTLVNEQR